jgi:geranyl-CoA carboxylase alpha subunit
VRLCAEDPAHGYLPQSGRIVRWSAPPLVRCDHALASGTFVSSFYDSMLGKLVAHQPSREGATRQLAEALDRTVCLGVASNRAFLARVLRHPSFLAGAATTSFLPTCFADDASRRSTAPSWLEALAAGALAQLPRDHLPASWAGWSSSPALCRDVPLGNGETTRGEIDASVDGRRVRAIFARDGDTSWWLADGAEIALVDAQLHGRTSAVASAPGSLLAPMHGRVTQVLIEAGSEVAAGALLVVLEAMKMEHQIRAPRAGIVGALHAKTGDQVAARQCLVEMAV